VFLKGEITNSRNLGFLDCLTRNPSKSVIHDVKDWKTEWHPQIREQTNNTKINYMLAANVMGYTNTTISNRKAMGKKYFDILKERKYKGLSTNIWMLNPAAGCPKKGGWGNYSVVQQKNDEGEDDQGGDDEGKKPASKKRKSHHPPKEKTQKQGGGGGKTKTRKTR
jgi:hypothetical protein